jgi:hypothetical protein
MSAKSVLTTAAIALAVVVAHQKISAGGFSGIRTGA